MSARFPCLRAQGTARRQGQTSCKAFRPGLRGEASLAVAGLHIWKRAAGANLQPSPVTPSQQPLAACPTAPQTRKVSQLPSSLRWYVLPRGSREKALAREAPVPVGKACKDGWVHSKCERFSDRRKAHLQTLHQPDCIFTSPALPTVRVLGSLWCATHRNSSCFV